MRCRSQAQSIAIVHRFRRACAHVFTTLAWACFAAGCTTSAVLPTPTPSVSSCDEVGPLFAVADVLTDPAHACYEWLDKTHGRVARSGVATAVLWTRRTAYGTGVLVSAIHTLGAGWFGPAGTDVAETVHDATTAMGVARITLFAGEGQVLDARRTPMFDLYNSAIPAVENTTGLTDILPRHDFYLAVIDGQKLEAEPFLEAPGPLTNTEPPLYDPAAMTTTAPTFAKVDAGALVLMLGFPQSGATAGELTAGVGRVLDDAEARAAIVDLAAVGDVEGDIPYDAEAEMIVAGAARSGMSGGGVFDTAGRFVGVLVRASDPLHGGQYVRIVRMSFIVAQFNAAFAGASDELQQALAPYLEPRE